MDIITILKEDHREVEGLFGRIEAASDRALRMKEKLFEQAKDALTLHAAAEEEILYPRMRELAPLRQASFEAVEEHRLVKQLLTEISELETGNEVWGAKVKVLIDMVRHHVREEEGNFFKALRSELGRVELRQMGEAVQAFKESHKNSQRAPSPRRPSEVASTQIH